MFFPKDSPIWNVPRNFNNRSIKILDSLRFTLQMIEHCYLCLIHELKDLSFQENTRNYPKVFHYAWSIIDYAQRFSNIYKNLNPPEDSPIFRINYVYNFRCAFQHLDKNIDNRIIPNEKPIYGALRWAAFNKFEGKRLYCLAISGIMLGGKHPISDPRNENFTNDINEIILELEPMKREEENEINISKLIDDLKDITKIFDNHLKKEVTSKGYVLSDWIHKRDILIKFPEKAWKKKK